MMFETIIFYNHGNLGDVLISKYFIREVIEILKPKHIIFSNKYDNSYTSDISEKHLNLKEVQHLATPNQFINVVNGNTLFFNTWFGLLCNNETLSKFGLSLNDRAELKSNDGILYNWENYLFFFDIAVKLLDVNLGLEHMLYNKMRYVPLLNKTINQNIPHIGDDRLKVLLYNQIATSGQADNESFESYLGELVSAKTHIIVYCSQPTNIVSDNLVDLSKHLVYPDLVEAAALSLECDIICGPGNATTISTWWHQNLSDRNKTYITINRNDVGEAILFEETKCKNIIVKSTKELFAELNKIT